MDYRKLISFGKGGYVISVPKDWVNSNNLKKGSLIYLEKNGDSLTFKAKETRKTSDTTKKIDIGVDGKSAKEVVRIITSTYLNAFDSVQLYGDELKEKLPEIKEHVQKKLMAFEITESTKNRLVINSFMDLDQVSVEKSFRKIDFIVRSMIEDAKTGNPELFEHIIERDNEVDRHFFLILKVIQNTMHNPALLKNMGLNFDQLIFYRDNAFILESIADEMKRFVLLVRQRKSKNKKIFSYLDDIKENYSEALGIAYKNDLDRAYDAYSKNKKTMNEIDAARTSSKDEVSCLEACRNIYLLINKILKRIIWLSLYLKEERFIKEPKVLG